MGGTDAFQHRHKKGKTLWSWEGRVSSARLHGPRRVVAPGSKLGKYDLRERGVGARWGMPSVF